MQEPLEIRSEQVAIREDEIDLVQIWGILSSGKWVIAGFVVLMMLVGAGYLAVTPPTYRASTVLRLTPWRLPSSYADITDTATQLQIIESYPVLSSAANSLELSVKQLREKLKVAEKGGGAGMLEVSVTGQHPEKIATTVSTVVKEYLGTTQKTLLQRAQDHVAFINQQMQRLEADLQRISTPKNESAQQSASGLLSADGEQRDLQAKLSALALDKMQQLRIINAKTPLNVNIVRDVAVPDESEDSKTALVLALSLVLGAMIGCGIVFLRAALRHRVDSPRSIEQGFGLPVQAVIPYVKSLAKQSPDKQAIHLVARDHPDEVATEALRSLRTGLAHDCTESGNNIILFTAPAAGAGKNFIAANLGYLLAETEKKVIIVDADMRRGKLHEVNGRSRQPGLAEILTDQVEYKDTLNAIDNTSCYVMPSGAVPPNPAELLTRGRFHSLLTALKAEFDYVVVVAPPILAVTDAAVISGTMADISTFLVVRSGKCRNEELAESIRRIQHGGGYITGTVFNGLAKNRSDSAGSLSFFHYEYKSQG